MRLMGAVAGVEALRVFQQVSELILRRVLKPDEIRCVVGAVSFQVEFLTGREFGMRVRGEGIALLHRTRELLQMLEACTKVPG
jgi:hypothetical protein